MEFDSGGEFDMISAGFGVCGPIETCLAPPPSPMSSTELVNPATSMFKSPLGAMPFLSGYEISYVESEEQSVTPVVDCVPLVHNEEIISSVAEEVVNCEEVVSNSANFSVRCFDL